MGGGRGMGDVGKKTEITLKAYWLEKGKRRTSETGKRLMREEKRSITEV